MKRLAPGIRPAFYAALLVTAAVANAHACPPTDCGSATAAIPLQLTPEDRASWEALDNNLKVYARNVAKRGDPRSLLAAALIYPNPFPISTNVFGTPVPAEARAWFDLARQNGSTDSLVAWVDADHCQFLSTKCDAVAAARHLVELEPRNAAAHLAEARAAYQNKDSAVVRAEIDKAARADEYQTHVRELYSLLRSTLDEWNPPVPASPQAEADAECARDRSRCDVVRRDTETLMIVTTTTMEGYEVPARQCMPSGAPTPDKQLRDACIAIYRNMAKNDESTIGQRFSLSSLSILTWGSADGAQWRDDYRRLLWVESQWMGLVSKVDEKKQIPWYPEYFDTLLREGEVAAMRSTLRRLGVALDPPANWLPDGARDRAVILTGRYPVTQ
jgi:hypothetical protein